MQGIFNYILRGQKSILEELYTELLSALHEGNNKRFSKHEAQCLLLNCNGVEKIGKEYTLTLGMEHSGNINHVEFQPDEIAEFLAQIYPDLELEGFGGLLDFETTDYYSPAGSQIVEFVGSAEHLEIFIDDDNLSVHFTCSLCDMENEIEIEDIDEDGLNIDCRCDFCGKEYCLEVLLDEEATC